MANELTGEFDVVAQFALPAVNRVLAAMHSSGRFPHSMTARVDDTPPPTHGWRPSITSILDALGDAIVDADSVGGRGGPHRGAFDSIVNDILDVTVEPIEPSHMKGRAQLQLFPPTLQIATGGASRVTTRLQFLARYFPDAGTAAAAEFVRGELHITGAINEVASEVAHVMEVDIHASTAEIRFVPIWSSRALSAQDIAGIELLIRNALRTSFVPSSIPLPSTISHVKFATLPAGQGAVAALLNMAGASGNPANSGSAFIGSADHFALGIGRDYLMQQLEPTLQGVLAEPIQPVTVPIDVLVHTFYVTYAITLNDVRIEFENGRMILVLKGHAHTGSSLLPDFSFTVRQTLTLAVFGNTARLVIGPMDIDTSSWRVNIVKGRLSSSIAASRDESFAKNDVDGTVQRMLSADTNLGGMMSSLLTPSPSQPSAAPVDVHLAYTSAEIRASGIILHGTVDVDEWPAPAVQFEKITATSSSVSDVVGQVPTHSALLSWIPGGTIDRYEWRQNGSIVDVETNRFVFIPPAPSVVAEEASPRRVRGFSSMCLTVQGTRISASGPVSQQTVTAMACTFPTFPVLTLASLAEGEMPMVALTQPAADGTVEVTGHAPAGVKSGSSAPNLIVRFAPDTSEAGVDALLRAAAESRRSDAELAVVLVLPAAARARSAYDDRVIYADDENGAWRRHFGQRESNRSTTLVVDAKGSVIFSDDGAVNPDALTSALARMPVNRMPVRMQLASVNIRAGRQAPNFLFEHAPGHTTTLRKLAGRDVIIVFWRAASEASIAAVRRATSAQNQRDQRNIVLAINDGDSPDAAKRAAREAKLTATVVTDPDRRIAEAYGVSVWPTTISIDRRGRISDIKLSAATHFQPDRDSGKKS